jgi:hypothetical protein
MANIRPILWWIAELNADWQIELHPQGGDEWFAYLLELESGEKKRLGVYNTLNNAKAQSLIDANKALGRDESSNPQWRKRVVASTGRTIQQELRSQERRAKITSLASIAMGVAAVVAGILVSFSVRNDRVISQNVAENEVRQLEARLNREVTRINALTEVPNKNSESATVRKLAALEADMHSLTGRLANYEASIGDDPAKRLAVPILRRDVDTLRQEHKDDITAIHGEMDHTLELMKWLLLLFGAGSFFSGIIGNWPSKSKNTSE